MHKQSLGTRIGGLYLLTIVLFSVMFVHAQEFRGLILGRVTDSSGAVVPNATVTAVGPQQRYTATTNATGDYTIPFVQPGTYSISAEGPGFKKTTQQNVIINVSQKINVNFALEVGAATQTVTVQADLVGVNTADASGGTTIDYVKMQNLPLNGRQVYMLLPVMPGVRFTSTVAGQTGQSGTRGWDETNAYVVNGVQGSYNQFTLNGASVTQQTSTNRGAWNIAPNVDAVEEFKVMTNTYDAQYGRAGGGTINTVLKGGTNEFHGTAFDFWRNSVLDANSYNNNQNKIARPGHNQHQFGGTVGGPVRIPHLYNGKDKTFFFFSFEGWREVLPGGNVVSVPAADLHPLPDGSIDFSGFRQRTIAQGGEWNGIYDPLTTHACTAGTPNCSGGYTRDRFVNDIIPASRVSPIGLKMLSLFPMPNKTGLDYDNYVTSTPGRYKYNQPIVRIDHNFSDNTRMYGMFAWWSGTEFRNTGGIPGPGMLGNINDYRSSLTQVLDVTHTFNPHLFMDVRASFNRSYNRTNDGAVAAGLAKLDASDLGLTMPAVPTTSHRYAPEIQFSSAYANLIGNETTPQMYETYELAPSLSQVIGHHNLHYGAQIMLSHNIPCCGIGSANGNFYFDSSWTQQDPYAGNNDGADLAALLLGYPTSGGVDNNLTVYESYKYYAGYIQDDWKVRHNLTLNLGLRWDVETSPVDRFHRLNAGFCMTCVNPLSSNADYSSNIATYFPNNALPNGATMINPLVGGFKFSSDSLKPYDTQFNHWQPRFGFSWGLNNKTVLRGGYGINQAFAIELGGSTTWTQNTPYNSSPDNGLTPSFSFAKGTPFPNGVLPVQGNSLGLLTGVGSSQFFDQRNRKIPNVQQYSLGIQRELPAGIVLDVEYVGSYTKDLRVGTNFNILTPEQFAKGHENPNYLNQQVPNPFYGVLDPATEMGSNPTIAAKYLMTPFPEFGGILYSYVEPVGYSNYNSMIVKAEKKLSGGGALINGLNFLASFTWSKAMQATSYLNNAAVGDNTPNSGLRDKKPIYMLTSSDRPWDFAFSGVYGLPIGKNGLIGKDAHGVAGQLLNNWTLDYIFTYSGGAPTSLPNTYFYSCSQNGGSFKPKKQSWSEWLYNETPSCFASMPPYTARMIVTRQSGIRNPSVPQLSLAIAKKFKVKEGVDLQFKTEAFNLTNTPLFGGPSTGSPRSSIKRNPTILEGQPGAYSGYGTIGSMQQNLPRQLQMSLKLFF